MRQLYICNWNTVQCEAVIVNRMQLNSLLQLTDCAKKRRRKKANKIEAIDGSVDCSNTIYKCKICNGFERSHTKNVTIELDKNEFKCGALVHAAQKHHGNYERDETFVYRCVKTY